MYGLSSLVALGPMWVASLFLRRDVNLPPFLIRLACAILASIAAVASSRTAIVAVIAAAPFILLGALLVIGVRPGRNRTASSRPSSVPR